MSKRNLLLIVFSICLVLSGGCGGSKSGKSNSIVLSSDYAGYKVGYKLTCNVNYTDFEENPAQNVAYKYVYHTLSADDAGNLKVAEYREGSPYKCGNYIKKLDNKYYEIGDWDEEYGDDYIYDEEDLILEAPLVEGVKTDYGTVLRSEKITLLGKKYDAWYIEDENENTDKDGNSEYSIDKTWFVPYIGKVRYEYIEKYNDEIIFEGCAVLSSAKYEAYEPSKSLVFSQSTSLKVDNQVRETRSKRSRLFDKEKL